MADMTVGDLLDITQEFLGEPVGGFYNLASRYRLFNQAQREMVEETRAIPGLGTVSVVAGTGTYDVLDGFMTFSQEEPYFEDAGGSRNKLRVTTPSFLDQAFPLWQDATRNTGTPMYVVLEAGSFRLYPTPDAAGTLYVPHIVDPTELADPADVPFNGISRLNRHSMGLAYYAAYVSAVGMNPQAGMVYKDMYEKELREMRHYVRTSPQNFLNVRPTPLEEG